MDTPQYSLWLEFEHTTPWDESASNDCAIIRVELDDGRAYGINVWTFDFLKTSIDFDIKEGKSGLFQIPPDLFVQQLTRECIEKTIVELLNQGNLEDLLNPTIFNLNFVNPWMDAEQLNDRGVSLKQELLHELHPQHSLFNKNFRILAKRQDNDTILIELENGKLATVHLTWKKTSESGNYPITVFFSSPLDFWKCKMKYDIIEYNE